MKFARTILSAWVCAILLAGCGKEEKPPLRFGLGAWPGFEFLHLAKAKGFLAEENVKVELVEFSSVADSVKAFERGQVDAFGATVVELLLARDRRARLPQAFYVTDISEGADVIAVRSPMKSLSDLRGKKVGLEFGSMNIYLLLRGLERAQMSLSDISPMPYDQGSIFEGFARGEIDAAVTWPPASYQMIATGKATIVFSSRDIPNEVIDAFISDPEIIKSRTRELAAVTRAFEKAVAFSKTHRDEAYMIMAERQGTTVAQFAQSVEDGLRIGRMAEQSQFFEPSGLLEKTSVLADRALRESGQLRSKQNHGDCYSPLVVREAMANQ